MGILLSIVGGGVITIATAMWVEYLRKPNLSMAIEEPPLDVQSGGLHRHLRLVLRNKPLPRVLRWVQRAAALECHGEVTFCSLAGQNIFGDRKSMAVRWSSTSAPVKVTGQIFDLQEPPNVQSRIVDITGAESRIDVYPGEEEVLDIAVRFDGEPDGYGWNNESYFFNWRIPHWKLPRGTYLIKTTITSSGNKCVDRFRLLNEVDPLSGFRLTQLLPEDRGKAG